jgi:hypothetical protein
MITSTSSSDRAARPVSVPAAGQMPVRTAAPRPDQLTTDNAALLRAALARQPEIRPEVVARACALATNPSYPSLSIVRLMAQQILAAPDLSEDES